MAFGSGSSLATDCWIMRGGSSPRRRRSKWAAPPGSTSIRPKSRWPTEGRRRLSPSVGRAAFFSFVQGVWGGDPPLGPLPAYAQKTREGGADGLPRDPLFGETLLEGGLCCHLQSPQARLIPGTPSGLTPFSVPGAMRV